MIGQLQDLVKELGNGSVVLLCRFPVHIVRCTVDDGPSVATVPSSYTRTPTIATALVPDGSPGSVRRWERVRRSPRRPRSTGASAGIIRRATTKVTKNPSVRSSRAE